jgi:hypothetical protein
LGGATGCGIVGVPGTYVNQDDPSEYLELKPDGSFYLKEAGMGVAGKWEVKGNELRLSWAGFTMRGEIRGDRITDREGKTWVKRIVSTEILIAGVCCVGLIIMAMFGVIAAGVAVLVLRRRK